MIIHTNILRCNDARYYVGTARGDLEHRIAEHNAGSLGGYTASRRPVTLVWSQEFEDPAEAIAAERRIKGWRRAKKEALIAGEFDRLPVLSKRKPKTRQPASHPSRRPLGPPQDEPGVLITDAVGTKHTQAGADARIASFVPSITELLIDLGLAGKLVARTRFCIHPAGTLKDIEAIGGTKKVSLAKLKAIAPTHAVLNIDENTKEMAEALRAFVPCVIVTHPVEPRDNFALYRLLGGIFGKAREAEDLCARLQAAMAALEAFARELPPARVCYFCWKDPWMTVSRDTYIARTLALVNLETVGHDDAVRYPEITIDEALIEETDLFLFSSEPYAFSPADIAGFAKTHGLPPGTCVAIDGEYASWYGSRAIAAMAYLRRFAKTLLRP
ncbi:MAG: helical backbone metal receptor [Alphaproteobacteria bacterium]